MTAFAAPRSLEGLRIKGDEEVLHTIPFVVRTLVGLSGGRFLRRVYQSPVFGWRVNSNVASLTPRSSHIVPCPGGGSNKDRTNIYCSLATPSHATKAA